jgi:putative oligomerization/nucleic acid binding protein
LIISVRLDKGVFFSSVIFTAPGLRSTGRLGLIEKISGTDLGANEDAVITAIPKDKAENLVEVIRNGMDKQREVSHQAQSYARAGVTTTPTISVADELAKLARLKKKGVMSDAEFQQMKPDLLKKNRE